MDRFLIWRNGKLGNTIVALPVIERLREAFPDAQIDMVVETLGRELLKYHPAINNLIVYNKRKEHRSLHAQLRFVLKLRKERYTHSIHLKRFFRNLFLAWLAGIPNRFGFSVNGKKGLLTSAVPYSEDNHIVETNYSILDLFNLPKMAVPAYRYYTGHEDIIEAEQLLNNLGLKEKQFIAIHCGGETVASNPVPYELFAELVLQLEAKLDMIPVFIEGPGDADAVDNVVRLLPQGYNVKRIRVKPIRTNAVILSKARCLIGNNSGQVHLAALYSIPTVVLYGPDSTSAHYIRKWLPWNNKVVPIVCLNKEKVQVEEIITNLVL